MLVDLWTACLSNVVEQHAVHACMIIVIGLIKFLLQMLWRCVVVVTHLLVGETVCLADDQVGCHVCRGNCHLILGQRACQSAYCLSADAFASVNEVTALGAGHEYNHGL